MSYDFPDKIFRGKVKVQLDEEKTLGYAFFIYLEGGKGR